MVNFSVRILFIYSLGLALLMVSCKTRGKKIEVQPDPVLPPTLSESIPTADSIIKAIHFTDLGFKWFTARVSANTVIDSKSNSFNANLRIKRDSVIWMSISPGLGIEVARVYITPDSLKFINRINNTYFKGDYRFLNSLLQIESNFQSL